MQLTFKGVGDKDNQVDTLIIYEDNEKDRLQQLLFYYYNLNPPLADICHAKAAGNIASILKASANNYKYILVFLDVVPLNLHTAHTYQSLCDISQQYPQCIILIYPILGAEYYFLRSILPLNLMSEVEAAVIQSPSKYLSLVLQDKRLKSCLPFERFCKHILESQVPDCIKTKGNYKELTDRFYLEDCNCKLCPYNLVLTLIDKSKNYLTEYRIAAGDCATSEVITLKKLLTIQCELVDIYNQLCLKLSQVDLLPSKYRRYIQTIDYQPLKISLSNIT